MPGERGYDFKISIIGPTRVGKTSLIAAMLEKSQELLAGSPVSMKPAGSATEKRLQLHFNERQGALMAREFNPGALRGTQEKFVFDVILDAGFDCVNVGFIDYPGAWLDAATRTDQMRNRWENECIPWINDSTILLVPIDAAVLMEAILPKHRMAVPSLLNIHMVAEVTRLWAKLRRQKEEEPGLLLFCPLKCETYFNDNSGMRDDSKELFQRFETVYDHVLEAVRQELQGTSHVSLMYSPIDTYGCVELLKSDWRPDSHAPTGLDFSATYKVRLPTKIKVKGADTILIALCKHLVMARKKIEENKVYETSLEAQRAIESTQEDLGFIKNIWRILSGQRVAMKMKALGLMQKANIYAEHVRKFDRIIQSLAKRDFDSRIRYL